MRIIPTTLKEGLLAKYLNPIFVETGTANGGGVEAAIKAGFEKIYSIEIDQERQLKNVERFSQHKEVVLITGDSGIELTRVVSLIDQPATFWLDAHFEKRHRGMRTWCPLYDELKIIGESMIKTHTIMIDDMRVVGKQVWGKKVAKDGIIDHILEINGDYKISFEDNTVAENDIMVAQVGD